MSKEVNGTVTARVRVEIEVPSGSCWAPSTTMDQITRQAIVGALGKLERLTRENGIRVVGQPTVLHILADDGKALVAGE